MRGREFERGERGERGGLGPLYYTQEDTKGKSAKEQVWAQKESIKLKHLFIRTVDQVEASSKEFLSVVLSGRARALHSPRAAS